MQGRRRELREPAFRLARATFSLRVASSEGALASYGDARTGPGCYRSAEIGWVRVFVLADTGSWLLDLKPNVGCALVDTPAAGFGLNQRQPPSSEAVKRVVTHDSLEPRPFVDDLCAQSIFIDVRPERDLALAVEYGVTDEFAYEELASVKHVGLEPARGELFEQTTRAT
jgi:hypothetical protein